MAPQAPPSTMAAKKAKAPTPKAASNVQQQRPLTHQQDPLLTISEVARQIGKSPSTVGRWCRDGLLMAQRMPPYQHWAIRMSVVNEFLRGSALEATVKPPDRMVDK